MKLTKSRLKRIIREELNKLAREEKLDELFGFGDKPEYQQDIADEEEAQEIGHTSAAAMHKNRALMKQMKDCGAFADALKFAAKQAGVKLPTTFFGSLDIKAMERQIGAADAGRGADPEWAKAYVAFAQNHPAAWKKMRALVQAECPDLKLNLKIPS